MLGLFLGAGLSLSAAFSALFLTIPHEGLSNKSYLDPAGVVTACYGHTGPAVKLGKYYTDEECLHFLLKDTLEAEGYVETYVTVPLNLYQKAALIDFTYNEGAGNLKRSTMLKKFNSEDYVGGCNELVKWVMANGQKLKGLVKRRNDELHFCLGGVKVIYE